MFLTVLRVTELMPSLFSFAEDARLTPRIVFRHLEDQFLNLLGGAWADDALLGAFHLSEALESSGGSWWDARLLRAHSAPNRGSWRTAPSDSFRGELE